MRAEFELPGLSGAAPRSADPLPAARADDSAGAPRDAGQGASPLPQPREAKTSSSAS